MHCDNSNRNKATGTLFNLLISLVFSGFLSFTANAAGMAENQEVQAFIVEMETLHGINAETLHGYFSAVTPNGRVLKFIAPPTQPGQRSWERYRSRFLDRVRIQKGAQFWRKNAATLAKAKAVYGVPEEIIVSIIGIETLYGQNTGNFNTFEALATLGFYYPRRAEYFRQELEQLLLLAEENKNKPTDYVGSYAGALGLPQFMPGSIRRYAVDFDGDGRIDLKNSPEDIIGSVARFLQQHGWQANEIIAVPAQISDVVDPAWLEAGIRPSLLTNDLFTRGVIAKAPLHAKVTLVDLVTPGQPTEYWLGFENFYVITRYNRSSFYAMSVYQLAKEIRNQYAP